MDITLTLRCNNKCVFCPRDKFLRIIGHVSMPEILKSIEKTRKKSDRIVLTGGEPTTMPEVLDVVRFCKKMKFKNIEMITNGRLLRNRQFAEKLVRAGVNGFAVSLYSFENKIHDDLTRVDGSAKETKSGIKTLLGFSRKYPLGVRVNMVLAQKNYLTILKTIRALYRIGVRDFIVAEEVAIDQKAPHLSLADMRMFLRRISKMNLRKAHICLRGFAPCLAGANAIFKDRSVLLREKDPSVVLETQEVDTFVKSSNDKKEYFKVFNSNFEKVSMCSDCLWGNYCPGLQKTHVKYLSRKIKNK